MNDLTKNEVQNTQNVHAKLLGGRPSYSDEQYRKWLEDIKPFLKIGNSLNGALVKAVLEKRKDSIYRKYRLNDWFCEKIRIYQSYPGEIANEIFT